MTGLTPVQAKTLAFIRTFIAEKGWSPSFDEICAGIGLEETDRQEREQGRSSCRSLERTGGHRRSECGGATS